MELPQNLDPDDFHERYRLASTDWRPAIDQICTAHDLRTAPIVPFTEGSNLVAAVGDLIVKVFPPFHRNQWDSERIVLPLFSGKLPVPVPELVASGERPDGWTYVVMTRVPGASLEDAWPTLPTADRVEVLRAIGATMRAAHTLPVSLDVPLDPAFAPFLASQIAGCRGVHERHPVPDWVIDGIDAFVAPALEALNLGEPYVLLTGEYTPFNLLIGHDKRLTAMLDFGDGMIGPPVYDLLGPAAFLCAGKPVLLQAFFEARGLLPWPLSTAHRRGLLALLLVHRYSYLKAQIRIPGWQSVGSLEALADVVFGDVALLGEA